MVDISGHISVERPVRRRNDGLSAVRGIAVASVVSVGLWAAIFAIAYRIF